MQVGVSRKQTLRQKLVCRFIKSTHGATAFGMEGNDAAVAEKKSGDGMQVCQAHRELKWCSEFVLSWTEMAGRLYHHSHQSLVVGPSGNDHDLGLGSSL